MGTQKAKAVYSYKNAKDANFKFGVRTPHLSRSPKT
jgi:hypothetical protein